MKPAAFIATQGSLFFLKQISEIDTSLIITNYLRTSFRCCGWFLHCALVAAQCIVIDPVCLFVGGCVCVYGCVCYNNN